MAKKLDVSRYRTFYISRMYSSGTKELIQGSIRTLVNRMGTIDKKRSKGYYEAPIELDFQVGKVKLKKLSLKELKEGVQREKALKLTTAGKNFCRIYLNMKFPRN
jgi:hypothetical protein